MTQVVENHPPKTTSENALKIANQCSPTVTQIGLYGLVWQVRWVSNVLPAKPHKKSGCEEIQKGRK